ncbi:MAG TPA: tryptophan synthase subunit alpha [Longimicrobiales bacterium]|nr:tryptophan synthase subunit alpha [Longimicrobiales bacterium]
MPDGNAGGTGRVRRAFDRQAADGRAALIAFIAAGDPDLRTTQRLARAAAEAGADIIELGIPFSDPLADGPVIQAAYTRALTGGATVRDVIGALAAITEAGAPPIVLMTSLNPVLAYGLDGFCGHAAAGGAAGLLVPDLLPEDADDVAVAAARNGLDMVFLAAPGGSDERIRAAADRATGFLYLVSRQGVTGEGGGGPGAGLEAEVRRARALCSLPIAVGFGVTTAADAARVAAVADGVIVGSALVAAAAEAHAGAAAAGLDATESAAAAVQSRVEALVSGIRSAPPPAA